jgi:undecaprenyl-diphosphatase
LLAPLLVPVAAVIALSRVSLRVHHVSDVVAGMLLGLAGAVAATALLLH